MESHDWEDRTDRLGNFLRLQNANEQTANDLSVVLKATLKVADLIATPTHFVGLAGLAVAILNSDQADPASRVSVISVMRPKIYPTNVATVAMQITELELRSWTDVVQRSANILHQWSYTETPLLTDIDRIFLRCCKASLIDLLTILKAAALTLGDQPVIPLDALTADQ